MTRGVRVTTEEFIEKAKSIHGDRYDYSLVSYLTAHKIVTIICKEHGNFNQSPNNHLHGHGCPTCVGLKKLTTTNFIEKAKKVHGDTYDYSLVEYTNYRIKIKIICNEHGIFLQQPGNHLYGNGCPKCCGNIKLFLKEFVEKAKEVHGDRYDYSLTQYHNHASKIKICCLKHGVFEQTANNHIAGHGCPNCTSNISKPELELQEFIRSIYPNTIITNSRQIIPPYELDIYLPDLKLAFEFNGEYWHSTEDAKRRDLNTKQLCRDNNIRLMIIWDRYWNQDKEKVKLAISNMIYHNLT